MSFFDYLPAATTFTIFRHIYNKKANFFLSTHAFFKFICQLEDSEKNVRFLILIFLAAKTASLL